MGFPLSDLLLLALAASILFMPGAAVLLAGGWVQRRGVVLTFGAAPAVTAGITYVAALLSGVFGVEFGVVTVLLTTTGLTAIAFLLGRRNRWPSAGTTDDPTGQRALLAAGVAGTVLAAIVAIRTWGRGLGELAVVPQEHDTVAHTLLTARIARTGEAAPWSSWPADVLSGEPDGFYPSGFHSMAATLADLGVDAVSALNAYMVVMFAIAMPAGLLALGSRLRWNGLGTVAGGAAAVVAVLSYRPVIALMHDGGILANGMAIALAPGLIAMLVSMSGERWSDMPTGALAIAGIVAVHPTAIPTVGVTVLTWMIGDLVTSKEARAKARSWILGMLPTALVGGVLLVPLMVSARSAAEVVTAWPRDMMPLSMPSAVGLAVGMPYGGFLDLGFELSQALLAALVAAGVACCLALRRHGGLVLSWLAWTAVTVTFLHGRDLPIVRSITSVFYNSYVRITGAMAIPQWLLAGVAVTVAAAAIGALVARVSGPAAATWGRALAAVVLVMLLVVLGRGYVDTSVTALESRYRVPHFTRVDDDDRAAFEWLASNVQPGERVMNNANDGSTYAYVYEGVPVVNASTLGTDLAPHTIELLQHLDEIDTNGRIEQLVRELDIAYVIADSDAPTIGVAPGVYWIDGPVFTIPEGFLDLASASSLTPVFQQGSVTIYAVDRSLLGDPAAAEADG